MIQRYYSEREEEEYSSASEEEEYNSESESEEQTTETLSTRAAQAQTTRSLPVVNDMEHAAEEGNYWSSICYQTATFPFLFILNNMNSYSKARDKVSVFFLLCEY